MKMSFLCMGLAIATAVIVVSAATTEQESRSADAEKLQSLLKERCDVWKEFVDLEIHAQAEGRATTEDVLLAMNSWRESQLDLVRDRSGRIAIFEEQLQVFKQVEQRTEAQVRSGRLQNRSHVAAKAARLTAEVRLLKEKMANGGDELPQGRK